ncbi:MAG: prolyl oligopeptidase family serine peptidase [Acidobacteria bacterium]|nr:prolyl oligopeptidase family serine peptidase [Acidobacteriota bacterium]
MLRSPRLLALALAAFLLVGGAAPGAAARAQEDAHSGEFSAHDTLRINNVGGPRISPDGEWILYTVAVRDLEDEDLARATQLWRIGVDGTGQRQLTHGEGSSGSPRWFPSGDKFAFTRTIDGKSQVWAMYTDGGEAWQVTEHEEGVGAYNISPDGEKVLFTSRDPETDEQKRRKRQRDDAVVIDAEFSWTHLWVHALEAGETKRLSEGDFTVSDPRWAPTSDRIAYVTRPNTKINDSWNSDIHVVDVVSGDSKMLYSNPGPDSSPRWSPDGKTIAFTAQPETGTSVWYNKLYLMPADGSADPEILLENFDLNAGAPIWAPNGADIYWSTGQGTKTNLFSVQLSTDEVLDHAAPSGVNFQFTLSPDGGRWVWVHANPSHPSELFTAPSDDLSSPTKLTDHNAWMAADGIAPARVETITWNNSEGMAIEGVVHYPPNFDGTPHPLVVHPHGGPSGAVTESFNTANQMLAANGFVVLQPNFRGSSNYGQEFLNANRDYWGIRDYDDIMTGVDQLVADGVADPDRMVAYGWSYGGYMTFWMSTQTDRFKLISPGAGLTNLYSMYSTTDIPGYLGWFFGTPWDNEDIYRRLSPIRHVKDVTAKILIMHGANDARVPPEQAVEFYQALRDLGKDVTYVSYPRQGHGIGEPRLQLDRLRRYVCAFTDAVGMDASTEECVEGVPAAPMDMDAESDSDAEGMSAQESGDGIFRVVER